MEPQRVPNWSQHGPENGLKLKPKINMKNDRFWPKSSQVPPKRSSKPYLFKKCDCSRKHKKTNEFLLFFSPRWVLKRPQNVPRPVQDGPKSDHFSCLIFASILDRFGFRFGSILGSFWAPRSFQNRTKNRSKFKLRQHASTGPPREAPRPPQELPRPPQVRPKSSQ